ncbi:MAG: imidazole glycerol phosphate synthase subunit HisH [Lachnospiraceae bacterium]|nr:imidazole glycerol phosphate synthase subunit HisH [Lachnospiraceae bacterium]
MTAIVDYGVGNLFSLKSSFQAIGEPVTVTGDPDEILAADRVILPGVGAFRDAIKALSENGLSDVVKEVAKRGTPLLGICLGMQLLMEKSYEYGVHEGLGLIPGVVRPLKGYVPGDLKIPEMGWNELHFCGRKPKLFTNTPEGTYVYFVHSYYCADCAKWTAAVTDYGAPVTAAVVKDNVMGCQFHPEKSGEAGLDLLRAFAEMI